MAPGIDNQAFRACIDRIELRGDSGQRTCSNLSV
jgi:hypothetical protein